MSDTIPLLLGRFRRLPRISDEIWQGGIVRLPMWVQEGPDGRPYRPWGSMWVSARTGLVHMKMEPEAGTHNWSLAFEALLEFGTKARLAGCRPARIEVLDAGLGERLREALRDSDLTIGVRSDLAALAPALTELAEHVHGGPLPPGALEGTGVTVEDLRAFAVAARRFYEAAPWRHLANEDLIRVESPSAPPGLGLCVVLGAGGQVFGLGFFDSEEAFEASIRTSQPSDFGRDHGVWSVTFDPVDVIPLADSELWEQHALPMTADGLYPLAVRFEPWGPLRRPSAAALAHLEGLLLALAATTETEIDSGRWRHTVGTHAGPMTMTLAIPALLEPLDARPPSGPRPLLDRRAMERMMVEVQRFAEGSAFGSVEDLNAAIQDRFTGFMDDVPSTSTTPLEKAQDLVYRAFDASGRRRVQLARAALDLSLDCADAYVIQAEAAGDAERARELYEQGMAAGERALGKEAFESGAGQFWSAIPTRPYMRARLGLAQTLEALDRTEEAIGHYRELLRLNPNDNQGVRYSLLPVLFAAGREGELGDLLDRYAGDATAIWRYALALATFRREGASPTARQRLRAALRANRHVVDYLTGVEPPPDDLPDSYALGSPEEAMVCADLLVEAWSATPGAVAWLRGASPRKKSKKRRDRSR